MNDLTVYGDRFVSPLSKAPQFSEGISRHHKPFYDDYNTARLHIHQAVGDITDFDLFGKHVLIAVFCRPNVTPNGIYLTVKEVQEDWYQTKGGLLLKAGPSAFTGDDDYIKGMYDGRPPQVGEWLFANASAGIQIHLCGDGASRPQGRDHRGEAMDLFMWDGWPCRIMGDDNLLGRIAKPQQIV